ncbi:MAG TPA: HAMP domain-containing sensor histidine kinase [Candidatus Limnocylindrales bacterium]|nr:HAMP domain-containing sensor histidine kinase [Candidatus Limnocylindrales bacterium]
MAEPAAVTTSMPERRPGIRRALAWLRRGYGLHLRLAFAGAVALFLCIAVLSVILMLRQSDVLTNEINKASAELERSMVERGKLLADGMAASMEIAIAGYDFTFLTDTVRGLQAKNENLAYAYLVNSSRVVIVHTDSRQVGSRSTETPTEKPRFLHGDDGRSVVEITRPLTVGGREWGWLVLGFDLSPIQRRAEAAVAHGRLVLARSVSLAMLVAGLVGVMGLVASIWTSRRLLSPLTQLAEEAAAIATGNLDQEIRAVQSSDEIGMLARQFEAMRRSIRASVGELLVAKQRAEAATDQEKKLRAEIEEHSRLLESKVGERTAELQATAERLTEFDRLKSEFLGNVSHELRTPIAAISSAAKIIQRYSDRDANSAKRFSKVIIEESERLTRLINDLLDISKIESGVGEWQLKPIADPYELLEHVEMTFRPLYQESGVELLLTGDDELPVIFGDRDRLIQVFANLCSNSLKFTPRGGQVRIDARVAPYGEATALRVTVTDSGPGIPEDEREIVFERFRQGGGGAKPRGTGLGLAICREVMRYHAGAIWAEGPEEGGTRMVVVIPSLAALGGESLA